MIFLVYIAVIEPEFKTNKFDHWAVTGFIEPQLHFEENGALMQANKTNYNWIEISTDVNNDINDGLIVVVVGVRDELQESIYMASNIRRKQSSWTIDWL